MDLKEQIRQQLEENKKSKGFGDTFEKIMIFTGIKRLVKWIYGEKDCGCDRRKDLWNKWFPYKNGLGCKEPCDQLKTPAKKLGEAKYFSYIDVILINK